MKNAVRTISIAVSFITFFGLFCDRATAGDRVIENIWFEKVSLTEERVFFKLGEYAPPSVYGLEGERKRLVCDFLNTGIEKDIPRTLPTDGDLVLCIRIGIHTTPKPKTRVVLDLAPIQRDYSIHQHFYEGNVFAVTVQPK